MMADSANGGELRLSPRRFGMANMVWTWCVGAWVRGAWWWRTWVVAVECWHMVAEGRQQI
ncbi:hypothetical protein ES332_A03G166600v1 [Gossypium tomentosum]|uniref:Uncharacterized protein n=1 Tax=Gossypium tomentosum TaxID=34277 RepID=A0A5D2RB32_GOSTO|nr:hypothetical protein ES332_A03G166600v1 [Gossypium tomentosum]